MWRWGERRPSAHVSESASVQWKCSLTTSLICFGSQMLLPWATWKWYFSQGNLWPHLIASCCRSHHIGTVIPKPKLLSLTKVLWHLAGLFSCLLKDDSMFCGSGLAVTIRCGTCFRFECYLIVLWLLLAELDCDSYPSGGGRVWGVFVSKAEVSLTCFNHSTLSEDILGKDTSPLYWRWHSCVENKAATQIV